MASFDFHFFFFAFRSFAFLAEYVTSSGRTTTKDMNFQCANNIIKIDFMVSTRSSKTPNVGANETATQAVEWKT